VDAGIDERRVDPLVAQQFLDGRDLAPGVHQLRGEGMAQPVRADLDAHPRPGCLDPVAHQILVQRRIAVQKDVVRAAQAARVQIGAQRPCRRRCQIHRAIPQALAPAQGRGVSRTLTVTYSPDPNGNMTLRVEVAGAQRITYTQAFDVESRLTAVTNTVSGAVTRFAYDGDGNRVLQLLASGGRTAYVGAVEVNITGAQRITKTHYSLGGQLAALRVISPTGNVLYYLHSDHLGSVSLVTCGNTGGCNGTPYQGAVARQMYSPYGTVRWSQGAPPTDIGFTGQRADATGLMFYQARYYSAYLNRFISPDTIIPDPANPQSLNRYSYVFNNPLKYVDSSGHIPVIPLLVAAVIVLIVPASNAHPAPPSSATLGNFPVNSSNGADCTLSLPDCFGNTVKLKDLPGYDVNAPLPEAEFTALVSKVAEDLYNHHTPSPGFLAGRGAYDTPFYNGGGRVGILGTVQGIYDADQQVCVEGLPCSGRSEINYFAQGMWSAAAGEGLGQAKGYAYAWKFISYQETPSADVLYWIEYGYKYYLDWLQSNGYDTYGYVEWLRRYNEEVANAPSIP